MLLSTLAAILLLPALGFAQTLVLIGGFLKDDNSPVWSKMVEAAGGVGKAKIGVVSVADVTTYEVNKVINNFVQVYGAQSAVHIRLTTLNVYSNQIVDTINAQTGIFLVEESANSSANKDSVANDPTSQERRKFLNTLRPFGVASRALTAIKSVISKGGMVAGNSGIMGRGAAILSGDSLTAFVTGTRYRGSVSNALPLELYVRGGLGLLRSGYILDSHLSERGRQVRLMRALLDTRNIPLIGFSKGLGVDENTALFVSNPLGNQPLGKVVTATYAVSGVFIVDVSKTFSIIESRIPKYRNIPFSFYTLDDTIDLSTGNVSAFASFKTAMTGEEYFESAVPSTDILSQRYASEWRTTARYLIDCKELNVTSYSMEAFPPKIRVFMDRSQAVGYGSDVPNDPNYNYIPSYFNMLASVEIA